ncbi:aminopeptidase N [Salsipaludibacter albus]|uniref:aminopeptidase N n=1 Tax=Salsipaludibacter albus TaxID=2849650 RepID=UPI001EE439A0
MSAAVHENLTRAEARERATVVDDVSLDVHLDLSGGDEVFGSTTTLTFRASPGGSTFLDCTADTVHEVVCNGRELDLDDVVGPTRIRLDDLAADNEVTVRATMRYTHEGRGLHHFRDPDDDRVYLHSQFEPFDAHLVYACFDQPDLKAPFRLAVDAPADWVVVSNGAVEKRPAEGVAGTWRFVPTGPLSPYVTAVVAGEYVSVHDDEHEIPLGLYVRRSLAEHLDADELFDLTRAGFAWFNDNFGIHYPFRTYDQLFVPEFSAGAMENPGCVTISENYLFRGPVTDAQRERRAETLLHEMAHMWFGDLVTMRWWDDLWLNESFASFAAVLSQVEATRFTHAWTTFLDAEKAWAKRQDQLPSTHPIAADMVDIESVHQNFDGITYAKGASVLRQLVAWVGQDAFLAGVRDYFTAHAWGNAELADFLIALERSSGRDLGPWRDAWLTTTGVNTMSLDADVDADGRFTRFRVHQHAPDAHPTLRPHRMAIGVYDDGDRGLVRTHRVEVDVTGPSTDVDDLVGVDAGRLVLLNDDDLTYTKVRLDDRTLEAVISDVHRFAEPMPRALVWSAAWDMVRDAELSATDWVAMVVDNADHEDAIGLLTTLLARSVVAAEAYADPDHRDDLRARLADHAVDRLSRTTSGSQHQLAWVRHLAATACRADHHAVLSGLLDDTSPRDGLELDQDLRWRIVVALAREGVLDEDDIDAEVARDHSDFAVRNAATARAARPDPTAKEAAWARLVDDDTLSLTMGRQVWRGFQQDVQPELVGAWVDDYFTALDLVWRDRSTEWAIEFAKGMFPHAAASDALATTTRRHRDRPDLPGPIRRVLDEELDGLRRTLAARRLDGKTTA